MSDELQFGLIILVCALAAALALAYNRISDKVRIPAPAVFLLAAAIASNLFPALEHLSGKTVQHVVTICLIIILFDGGMHIGTRRFKAAAGSVAWIGVVGTFVTTAALALAAHYLFGFPWLLALLLGTALAPTDPAVVFSVLGKSEIVGRTGTILEGESGANDPVGIALLASLIAAGTLSGLSAVGEGALDFALQMVIGAAAGLLGGLALQWTMRRWPLPTGALYPLRTLFGVLAIFGLATVAHGSGFLAVFIAGIMLGDIRSPYKGEIERFHSALASLGEIVAFAILGLTINLTALWHSHVILIGLGIAAILAFVIRPVLVGALLAPIKLRLGERGFIMWAGLKGAVPILLGSFILSAGVDGASRVYNVIFVVVLFSVIVQGGLVPTVAKALKVPMRPVEPEPFSLGVRFRNEPQALRRYILERGAPADGCTLEELPLQEGTWVSLVIRNGSLVTVTGDTVLKAGDEIVALADPESEHDPKRMFTRAED